MTESCSPGPIYLPDVSPTIPHPGGQGARFSHGITADLHMFLGEVMQAAEHGGRNSPGPKYYPKPSPIAMSTVAHHESAKFGLSPSQVATRQVDNVIRQRSRSPGRLGE